MVREESYLKFEQIPECFYDCSLEGAEWENTLISELRRIGYYSAQGSNKIEFKDSQDIFPEEFFNYERDPVKYAKENKEKLEEERQRKIEESKEREERIANDSNRIHYDFDMREFLYNKGVDIPTNEMEREVYLRERISDSERKNLVSLLKGYSDYLVKDSEVHHNQYAVFGVGTSTYGDLYFENLKKMLFADGFGETSEFKEKAWAILDQNTHCTNYEDYIEFCFNKCVSIDGKHRPTSREKFEERANKKQKRYVESKNLGEYLERKGEDLDFAICIEELYGESIGKHPTGRYEDEKEGSIRWKKHIDSYRRNFIEYLEVNNFDFKEEIDFLDSGGWDCDESGDLIRRKNIKETNFGLSTVRVNFSEGRSMHFYFYNEMADMKVKHERIYNESFVQILRGACPDNREFVGLNDLEAAVKNGEETGIFENPLVLKWRKK